MQIVSLEVVLELQLHHALRRVWPGCQGAVAANLTMALSLKGAMVSSII